MKFLFIHNNYPAQFRHLVIYLKKCGHEILFLSLEDSGAKIPGVKHIMIVPKYSFSDKFMEKSSPEIIGWGKKLDIAQYFYSAFQKLSDQGYIPDFVVSHAGWGAGLFAKSIFTKAKLACYAEWWFQWNADDQYFDLASTYAPIVSNQSRKRDQFTNMYQSSELASADFIWSPTNYQKNQYPAIFQKHIEVIHEGVDIDMAFISERGYLSNFLPHKPITYATRGMEPMRGFEYFITILGDLLVRDQNRLAIIGGKDKAFYRKLPPNSLSMGALAKKSLENLDILPSRVNWTGLVNYKKYKKILQASGLHFYFTRPFVPSWSLIDAMASGCLIVASRLECVSEVVGESGQDCCAIMVDHFKTVEAVEVVEEFLLSKNKQKELRERAIERAVQNFDSKKQLTKLVSLLGL